MLALIFKLYTAYLVTNVYVYIRTETTLYYVPFVKIIYMLSPMFIKFLSILVT